MHCICLSLSSVSSFLFIHSANIMNAKSLYEKMSCLLPDNKSVLKVFRSNEFHTIYKFISFQIQSGGLESTLAESFLALTLISEIMFDGVLPKGDELMGFDWANKRRAILQNEIMVNDTDFKGVVDDYHVQKLFLSFKAEKKIPGRNKFFIRTVCNSIKPSIGWWAKEVVGQMDQFVEGTETQRQIAFDVYKDLLKEHPEFKGIVCHYFGSKPWLEGERSCDEVNSSNRKHASDSTDVKSKRQKTKYL